MSASVANRNSDRCGVREPLPTTSFALAAGALHRRGAAPACKPAAPAVPRGPGTGTQRQVTAGYRVHSLNDIPVLHILRADRSVYGEVDVVRLIGMLLALLLLGAGSVRAHHSFAAIFDIDQPLELTGKVTSVEWTNPHIHFSIEVEDRAGTTSEWRFEGFPPNMLVRQGWRRDETLTPGDRITVSGWRARSEPNLGAARRIRFADGRELTAGPPASIGGR